MSQLVIGAALDARLKEWAASMPVSVAFQNVKFVPPSGEEPYLRAYLLPAKTFDPSVGVGHRRYTGIYQISVCVAYGRGRQPAEQWIAALEALFARGTRLLRHGLVIWVDSTPSVGPVIQEADLLVFPVSVSYRCEVLEH